MAGTASGFTFSTGTASGLALSAGTAGTFFPTLGLLLENTVGEAELAGLLIDFEELHLYVVALFEPRLFNGLQTVLCHLGNVEESFFAGHEFHEASVRHDADDFSIVHFAHFGDGHNGTDFGHGGINALLVGS